MKYLVSLLVLVSVNAFAEEDLFAQFDRTVCQTDAITKEATCSLDGKKIPSALDKKQALLTVDDELDATTTQ